MNERIEALLLQVRPLVGDDDNNVSLPSLHTAKDIEKFAELIVRECSRLAKLESKSNKVCDAIETPFGIE